MAFMQMQHGQSWDAAEVLNMPVFYVDQKSRLNIALSQIIQDTNTTAYGR
jgi:hypothetical protein